MPSPRTPTARTTRAGGARSSRWSSASASRPTTRSTLRRRPNVRRSDRGPLTQTLDHRSKGGDVSDREVRNAPALTTCPEMVCDRLVGSDGEEGSRERVFDRRRDTPLDELDRGGLRVVGDDDCLHEHVLLER